jgi:pimeloyl-ACP methyl ester carboxylesterase
MSDGVRFCTTPDGVRLGYSVFGTGRPLVIIPAWWMSPEADRRRLIGRDFWNDLPGGYRTITYDRRGIGVSSREVSDVSLERQVADLQALTDHLKLSEFDLWCFGDAAAIGVTFIVRSPGRVNRLIMYTPWAYVGRTAAAERFDASASLIRADWGMASRMFAQMLYPKGPLEAQEASTKAIRETQSPEVALQYLAFTTTFDIRDALGKLALPVLVISREGPGKPPLIPVEASRWVASAIPGARFVEYDKAPATCPYYQYEMYRGDVLQFLADGTKEMPLHPTLSAREVESSGSLRRARRTPRSLTSLRSAGTPPTGTSATSSRRPAPQTARRRRSTPRAIRWWAEPSRLPSNKLLLRAGRMSPARAEEMAIPADAWPRPRRIPLRLPREPIAGTASEVRMPRYRSSGRSRRAEHSRQRQGRRDLPWRRREQRRARVTWVHSYVSDDKSRTYCVYDGPTPEAIRKAAERNGSPSAGSRRERARSLLLQMRRLQ